MMLSEKLSRRTLLAIMSIVMLPQLGLSLVNPAFARIGEDLHTTIHALQGTITVYMVGYALSMFAAGILAERFDASRLQTAGILLFTAGSLICAVAPSAVILGFGRFVQALGGTSATVLCRLIVQRRVVPQARLTPLAYLSMVISLTPAVAPLLGGLLVGWLSWRIVFVLLGAVGAVLAGASVLALGAAPAADPLFPRPAEVGAAMASAIRHPAYRWYAFVIAAVWMSYFGFISLSPALFQDYYRLSSVRYGLVMVLPAVGYWLGSWLTKRSADPHRTARLGFLLGGAMAAAVLALGLLGLRLPLALVVVLLSTQFIGVGTGIPHAQAGQLNLALRLPAVGAGLFFFLQMIAGAAWSAVAQALGVAGLGPTLVWVALPQLVLGIAVWWRRRGGKPV